eukprot:c9021_g1_i1.p1 GENE.c9021_g1_i1~~c9021_g1_i1.p1  ORF type:complete len:152 (-),score=36.94 c9021_g1_i1:9-464(-)
MVVGFVCGCLYVCSVHVESFAADVWDDLDITPAEVDEPLDSEDSNAEDNPNNDYPDEDEDFEWDEPHDYDDELLDGDRMKGEYRQPRHNRFDDDYDDIGEDSDIDKDEEVDEDEEISDDENLRLSRDQRAILQKVMHRNYAEGDFSLGLHE